MASDNKPRNKQGFTTNVPTKPAAAAPTISANDSSNRGFTLAIIALVVIGLGGVAFLATNRSSDISDAPQTAAVEVQGPPIEQYPRDQNIRVSSAANDPAVGQIAPTLIGTSFDDSEVRIEPDGRAKAVYFLSHSCQFCQAEVPILQELIDNGQLPSEVDVYAVSTAVRDAPNANYPPEVWLNRENWTPKTMRDDEFGRAFNAYGGTGFPYTVYLDGSNRIVARSAGQVEENVTLALWQNLAAGSAIDSVEGDDSNLTDADAEPADSTDAEPAE